jgi:hypothetical protein
LIPERKLGRLKAVYRERQFNWPDVFILFLPGILAIFLPSGYGIYLIENYYTQFGPATILPNTIIWFVLALFASGIFSTLVVYRYLVSRNYVAIFEKGLVFSHFGKKVISWKEIIGIQTQTINRHFWGMFQRTNYRCTLHTRSNSAIRINHPQRSLDKVIGHIKSNVYPVIYGEYQDQYRSKGNLRFGPIITYRNGISLDGRNLSWNDIRSITIQHGRLVLELAESSHLKIPIGEIPNAELFLQFIQTALAV